MENLQYEKDGKTISSPIVYAYEFNAEYVQTKDESVKDLICFVVKEEGEEDLIEYYLNRNTEPDKVWWHNHFFAGNAFEKKLKEAVEGESFSHRKKAYLYKKLTAEEVHTLVNEKVFQFYV